MSDNKVTWNVTTQSETTKPDSTGRFVSGVLVGFQTNTGLQGSVFVPDSQYSTEQVQKLVQARVDQMVGVQSLKG